MTHEQADAKAVEAAARAVHQARSWPSDPTWDDTTAFWRGICRTEAQAAIAAYLAALEARGFVVVPVEPTVEMLQEGRANHRAVMSGGVCGMTIEAQVRAVCRREAACWTAMLAARPKATP